MDWQGTIVAFYVEAILTLSVAIIVYYYRKLQKKVQTMKIEFELIANGLVAIIRNDIHVAHYRFVKTEKCMSIADRENIEGLYKSYHGLGGNGTVDDLMYDMRELNVYPCDEKKPPNE